MKRRNLISVVIATLVGVCVSPNATAQNGEFENLILDGGAGGEPFIRFDQTDNDPDFLVAFNDGLGFWVSNAYQFRIFQTAPNNALTLNSSGTNIKGQLNLDHPNSQTFSLVSLDSNAGFNNGGIGFISSSNLFPFWVFDDAKAESLAVQENGVGVGTYFPTAPLHVFADGEPFSEAEIRVENALPGPPVARRMLSLVNNGPARIRFDDTNLNSSWLFTTLASGKFSISKDGTGGPELLVHDTGRVTIGPGSETVFDIRANGNLIIAGTLTQSSDKYLKTAFASVDEDNILDRITEMPINTWQFKFDDPDLRHNTPQRNRKINVNWHWKNWLPSNRNSICKSCARAKSNAFIRSR